MSKSQEKKQKRKRKLQNKKKKDLMTNSYFYEGNKYRSEHFVPLMHAIEVWITCFDVAHDLRGLPDLEDQTIEAIYKNLIKLLREKGLIRPSKSTYLLWNKVPAEAATEVLCDVIDEFALTRGYSCKDVIGVLRTLNSSIEIWGMEGPRGYINYLQDNIGHLPDEARRIAGVQLTDDSRTQNSTKIDSEISMV